MAKRMFLMLAAMAVFVAAVGTLKFRQIQSAIAEASSFQPPPEAVTTVVARREQWPVTIGAIGTLRAVRGVTVAADLSGLVETIAFESGTFVGAGDVLVRLDTRQEQAQLAAAEAQRELARLNLERLRGLLAEGIVSRADYDRAVAEHKQGDAHVGEIRATIDRKTIRAPFAGLLGIRQVNLGQFLDGGAPIVSLQALDPVYVDFALPQQRVGELRVGGGVRVTLESLPGVEIAGRITAIDSIVDPATRNVQVQATLANPGGKLRPGMFVQTQVLIGADTAVVALPASAISYAPYGDSVFVVGDMKDPRGQPYRGVRQQFVKLGPERGDQVAVLTGVQPGDEVVTSGAFKLRNGAAVQVDNKVQPGNDPAPRPEDN
jgi:membrane fusion protein (multidrug efflux system)